MLEEEFGYALNALQGEVAPRLIAQGFQASISSQEVQGRPSLGLDVVHVHGDVEIRRSSKWLEAADGTVVLNSLVSARLTSMPPDHPYNVALANAKGGPLLPEFLKSLGEDPMSVKGLDAPLLTKLVGSLSPDFANNAHEGLTAVTNRLTPQDFTQGVKFLAQLLMLQEHAAGKGYHLSAWDAKKARYSGATTIGLYYQDDDDPGISFHLQRTGDRANWQVDAAYAFPAAADGSRDKFRGLQVAQKPSDITLIDMFERSLETLNIGKTPREIATQHLLQVAEDLKAAGHIVSTSVSVGTDLTEVTVLVGDMQGAALISARHIFQINEEGYADKHVVPSVRFPELCEDHRDNKVHERFDRLPPAGVLPVMAELRAACLIPMSGGVSYPEMNGNKGAHFTRVSLAHALADMRNHPITIRDHTPAWAVTLTQMLHAKEAAKEHGYASGYAQATRYVLNLAAYRDQPIEGVFEPLRVVQFFEMGYDPAGGLPVKSIKTTASVTGRSSYLAAERTCTVPDNTSLEDAIHLAAAELQSHRDALIAEARENLVANKLSTCWLESVDAQKGVAQVGVSPEWAGKTHKLVEVSLANWIPAGLSAGAKSVASQLGITDSKEVEAYAPIIERLIQASVAPALASLSKEAVSLKMSNVQLGADKKSITVTTEDPVSGAAKDVAFNIKKAGGQVVLARAEGDMPRRPYLDVSGVRALELLLAPVAQQMLEAASEKKKLKTKELTKSQDDGR